MTASMLIIGSTEVSRTQSNDYFEVESEAFVKIEKDKSHLRDQDSTV